MGLLTWASVHRWVKVGTRLFIDLIGFRRVRRMGRWLAVLAGHDGFSGDYEENGEEYFARAVLRSLAGDGPAAVVDVGASVGQYAELIVHLCEELHLAPPVLHLFEPNPGSFACLADLTPNLRATIFARPEALGAEVGEASFNVVSGAGAQLSSLHARRLEIGAEVTPRTIQVSCLDRYLEDNKIESVLLMKIDTEGADVDVLQGAAESLAKRSIRFIEFEYNSAWVDARHFLRDAFDLLLPNRYLVGKLYPTFVECFTRWDYRLEWFEHANYVAWPADVTPPFAVIRTDNYLTDLSKR